VPRPPSGDRAMQENIGLGELIGVMLAVLAVFEILARVIVSLIDKFIGKGPESHKKCVFNDAESQIEARKGIDEIRVKINEVHSVIGAVDEAGTRLVYFPRAFLQQQYQYQERQIDVQLGLQSKLLDRIEEINRGQERLANLLDIMGKTIEKLVDRVEKLL